MFGEDAILEVEEGYFYHWSNGGIGNKVKVSPTENSNYYVTVSNEWGQESMHTYTVEIDRTCSALLYPQHLPQMVMVRMIFSKQRVKDLLV